MDGRRPIAQLALLGSSGQEGWTAEDNPACRGARLAVDALARDPGLPGPLGWRLFDDRGDLRLAKERAEEIVADPTIVGVVGPLASAPALASAPVFNEAGLTQVSPSASHPDLCRRGFATFFRLVANDEVQGNELAHVAFDYLGARRVAVVHAEDVWAVTLAEIFARRYDARGGRVVFRSEAALGQDATSVVQSVIASNPDLVFFAIHRQQGHRLTTALRGAGLRAPFLGTDAMKPSFFLGGGAPDAEAYHTHSGADFRRLPSAAAFRKAYGERFPENSTYSPEAYDAVMILAEALRRAGVPDRARVLYETHRTRAFPGVSGSISFDATGERIGAAVGFYHVQNTGDRLEMAYLATTSELLQPGNADAPRRPPLNVSRARNRRPSDAVLGRRDGGRGVGQ